MWWNSIFTREHTLWSSEKEILATCSTHSHARACVWVWYTRNEHKGNVWIVCNTVTCHSLTRGDIVVRTQFNKWQSKLLLSFLLCVYLTSLSKHNETCREKHAFAPDCISSNTGNVFCLSSLNNFAIDEAHFTCHRPFSSVMNGLIKI